MSYNWSQHENTRTWVSIASDSTGANLAAVVQNGYIYTSSDSGVSWTPRKNDINRNWTSIASDSTGQNLAACVQGGNIWTSTSGGQSWTENIISPGTLGWTWITSNSTGQYLAAVIYGGYIYTSSDSGVSWTPCNILNKNWNWTSIASDSTGQYLAACIRFYNIFISTDGGKNWIQKSNISWDNLTCIASSSDGTKLAAASYGNIWISDDGGESWTKTNAAIDYWQSIASSSDGTKLAAVVKNGYIYTSSNSGVTWTEQTSAGQPYWYSIASSNNGNKLATVAYNGNIWTGVLPPTITTVSPISGSVDGGTSVTITGTNFTGATAVTFGATPTSFTVDSDTQITCTSPAGSLGTVDVTVTTPGGDVTSTNAFTYAAISYTPSNAGSGYNFTLSYTGIASISGHSYVLKNGTTQLSIFTANGSSGTTYTFNNVTIYTAGPNTLSITDTNTSNILDSSITVNVEVICFLEDSKILTDKGYVPIQNLKKGDLVKTLLHGFVPIYLIGKRGMYHAATNDRNKDQLYTCSKNKFEEVFEDLVITGAHSLLVDNFTNEEQREKTNQLLGDIYVTDNKYRVPACVDNRTSVYKTPGTYTIYHLALEHDDYYMNYGIYANGLLVETCSKRYLKELSGMFHL